MAPEMCLGERRCYGVDCRILRRVQKTTATATAADRPSRPGDLSESEFIDMHWTSTLSCLVRRGYVLTQRSTIGWRNVAMLCEEARMKNT